MSSFETIVLKLILKIKKRDTMVSRFFNFEIEKSDNMDSSILHMGI